MSAKLPSVTAPINIPTRNDEFASVCFHSSSQVRSNCNFISISGQFSNSSNRNNQINELAVNGVPLSRLMNESWTNRRSILYRSASVAPCCSLCLYSDTRLGCSTFHWSVDIGVIISMFHCSMGSFGSTSPVPNLQLLFHWNHSRPLDTFQIVQ